jgi:uncharacterized integral membrane protein
MQVIRTVVWIVITAILVAFVAMNWDRAPVNFWPLEASYLHFDWPVGVIALFFFVLGWLPMYLIHRAARWRFGRRIASLENNFKTAPVASPLATPTRQEADAAADRAERDEP